MSPTITGQSVKKKSRKANVKQGEENNLTERVVRHIQNHTLRTITERNLIGAKTKYKLEHTRGYKQFRTGAVSGV